MEHKKFFEEVNELVRIRDLGSAIEQIQENLDGDDDLNDTLLLLSAQWESLQTEEMEGQVSNDEFKLGANKISKKILTFSKKVAERKRKKELKAKEERSQHKETSQKTKVLLKKKTNKNGAENKELANNKDSQDLEVKPRGGNDHKKNGKNKSKSFILPYWMVIGFGVLVIGIAFSIGWFFRNDKTQVIIPKEELMDPQETDISKETTTLKEEQIIEQIKTFVGKEYLSKLNQLSDKKDNSQNVELFLNFRNYFSDTAKIYDDLSNIHRTLGRNQGISEGTLYKNIDDYFGLLIEDGFTQLMDFQQLDSLKQVDHLTVVKARFKRSIISDNDTIRSKKIEDMKISFSIDPNKQIKILRVDK